MATLAAQYTYALPNGSSLSPRIDVQYQSGFFKDLTNTALGEVPTNITQGQPGAPREWLVSLRRNF